MASFTELELKHLQSIPIVDILAAFGKNTDHGRDNLFYSPFRDESTPSFHIGQDGHRWYDFGSGEGGGAVTLVCRLLDCNGGKAYDVLASVSTTFVPCESTRPRQKKEQAPAGKLIITDVTRPFKSQSLIDYAMIRGISRHTLDSYCREVTYAYDGQPKSSHKAIGFRNNRGGWVLRTPRIKRCTSSDITTIDIYRECSDSPTSPFGLMFEGFFDFLSYIEITGGGWPKCDICILNSVTNTSRARQWITAHNEICTLFDNDAAGRKALGEVKATASERDIRINDWSSLYEGFNDLNERLASGKDEKTQLTIQHQSLWNNQFLKRFRID